MSEETVLIKKDMGFCTRCEREEREGDLRTLSMSCFYDMSELDIPLTRNPITKKYWIVVCKECRGDWLLAIKSWFENPSRMRCDIENGIFKEWARMEKERENKNATT